MPHDLDWRQWEKLRANICERARQMYVSRRTALAQEVLAAFRDEVPEHRQAEYERQVARWMVDWEAPAKVERRRSSTALNPHTRMADLTRLVEANKERLERAIEDSKDKPVNFADAQTYRIFVNTARDLYVQLEQVATNLDVEDQWGAEKPEWLKKKRAIYNKVYREYRGRGEVYSMLCDRLAALQVGLSRLEALGRIDSDQYKNLSEQFVATAAQIQRHTESLKVEDVSPVVQQVGQKFFQILESHLLSTQPALLARIEADIAGNVVEGNFESDRTVRLLEVAKAS